MEFSSHYLEIFGGDDLARPTPQREPGPVIDDLFEYMPAGTAADVLSRQLSDDELVSEISGLEPTAFRKAVSPVLAPVEFNLDRMITRAASAVKKAPEHRRQVEKMVNGMRNQLRKHEAGSPADFDLLYSNLANSITGFVQRSVITG
jgi:hypothetical protein